jgi:DNA-binding NarL/FixJ family response regulator
LVTVLIVEDHQAVAESLALALRSRHHHEVVCRPSPEHLDAVLARCDFQVAIIDLLFRGSPAVSGLSALDLVSNTSPDTKLILWTAAEENRILHLGVAFGCFELAGAIPKDISLQDLEECISSVLAGKVYFHPELAVHRVPRRQKSAGELLLASDTHANVWRAIARGARSRDAIAKHCNYSPRTVGDAISDMNNLLVSLMLVDPDINAAVKQPAQATVVGFAVRHREFFLDETVARLCSRRP